MRIRVSRSDLTELKADVAVCFAHEGDATPRGIADAALRRELGREMKADGFRGRPGDRLEWSTQGRYGARRFVVLGLGPKGQDPALRIAAARAARAAQEHSARRLALRLPDGDPEAVREAVEGVILGAYRFERYLTDAGRRDTAPSAVEISSDGSAARARKAAALGESGARAVCLARDLVNEPPSRLNPPAFARQAVRAARSSGLRSKVIGPRELEKIGMGALLAVSRGSAVEPRVVRLTYRPKATKSRTRSPKRILLVGKGVTFDSGGLNLKPSDNMATMKMDMGGAAAVLAAMTALSDVGCGVEVHGYIGLVENMTGGAAYKPGDVLKTWSGKTVEIGNTDAEGRLVLCDLLAHGAATIKPTQIVDLATLTGACVVALGLRAAGLFSRDDKLRDELLCAAAGAGEKLWPLPLYDDYLQPLKKGPADLRNIGGRWGGAITAALFLGEFVPRELPWAHVDIAGPAFAEEELPEAAMGGTGAGVLTLVRWLEAL